MGTGAHLGAALVPDGGQRGRRAQLPVLNTARDHPQRVTVRATCAREPNILTSLPLLFDTFTCASTSTVYYLFKVYSSILSI